MKKFLPLLNRIQLYNRISNQNVIEKQRFVLFRILTFTGIFACIGTAARMQYSIEQSGIIPYVIYGLGLIMLINFYFILHINRQKIAYLILISASSLLLHFVAYSCGGVQTGGTIFFCVLIIYAFMLLGRRSGQIYTLLVSIHIIYMYFITEYTNWTSFAMFNNDSSLISQDFMTNILFVFFLIGAKANYLQSSKNIVIQNLERAKETLEQQNQVLNEYNQLLHQNNQKLELANKEHERFAFIVSHNLRAPVASILGIANLVADENLDVEQKTFLAAQLSKETYRLDEIVVDLNDILSAKEIDENEVNTIRFSNLLEKVNNELQTFESLGEITIESDFSEVEEISADNRHLSKIFFNLIQNSIKFRDPSKSSFIKIRSQRLGDCTRVIFKDNGIGIDMDQHRRHLFGLYRRFHPEIEGKGKGLALVKTSVDALGGIIQVKSKPLQGTEFLIDFK